MTSPLPGSGQSAVTGGTWRLVPVLAQPAPRRMTVAAMIQLTGDAIGFMGKREIKRQKRGSDLLRGIGVSVCIARNRPPHCPRTNEFARRVLGRRNSGEAPIRCGGRDADSGLSPCV